MLKAAVDVFYKDDKAKAVCVLFQNWKTADVFSTHTVWIEGVEPYEPGAFFRRELPCILKVLEQVNFSLLDTIVVDGYVFLDEEKGGLGAYLFEALGKRVPVVGVAKTKFHGNTKKVVEVRRGESRNPLFVTAVGMEVEWAAECIQSMAGPYRIPYLLQYLDRKTREEDRSF